MVKASGNTYNLFEPMLQNKCQRHHIYLSKLGEQQNPGGYHPFELVETFLLASLVRALLWCTRLGPPEQHRSVKQ